MSENGAKIHSKDTNRLYLLYLPILYLRYSPTLQMYFKALDGLLVGIAANAVYALGGLRGLAAATTL